MTDLMAVIRRWVGQGADVLAYLPLIGTIGCILLAAIIVVLGMRSRLRGSSGSIVPSIDECTIEERTIRTVTITRRRG